MMSLSQTVGYAVHALGYVANSEGKLCLIRDIAQRTGIPKPYLAKITNQLSRKGVLAAKRGYRGGIFLARAPEDVSLLEIVQAIEGENWIGQCMLGLGDCAAQKVCPTHEFWQDLRKNVEGILNQTTLEDVLCSMRGIALGSRKRSRTADQGQREPGCSQCSGSLPVAKVKRVAKRR
jgi:Rrf2 family protein